MLIGDFEKLKNVVYTVSENCKIFKHNLEALVVHVIVLVNILRNISSASIQII